MAPRLDEFLFDTSALLKYYRDEDGSAAVRFWIDELPRQRGQGARLFLPNICIPEALSFFYRLCHLQHEVTDDTLKRLVATFLNDLQQGKFAVYNLSRRDIFATEPLYGLAHEEYRRRRHRRQRLLSPMDIIGAGDSLHLQGTASPRFPGYGGCPDGRRGPAHWRPCAQPD